MYSSILTHSQKTSRSGGGFEQTIQSLPLVQRKLFVPAWRSFLMVVQPLTGFTTFQSNVGLCLISLTVRYCTKYFKLNVPCCNFKLNIIVQSTTDMEIRPLLSLFAMAFYVSGNKCP